MATCRSCKAEIIWAETEAGKRIPLDTDTFFEGNLVVLAEKRPDGTPIVHTLKKDEPRDTTMKYRRSHFATCKDANKWRKS